MKASRAILAKAMFACIDFGVISLSQGSVACSKFYKGPQEELWAEKCRRTAKHDKPLHTLQTLHRMKSF